MQLFGNRFFTFNTVVRVNQIEVGRHRSVGVDESAIHSPKEARQFRNTIAEGWPGARITWAFSWLALNDNRQNYRDLRINSLSLTMIDSVMRSPSYPVPTLPTCTTLGIR
jgi:hypothetical protein